MVGVCVLAGCATEAPGTEDVVASVEEPSAETEGYLTYNMWDCAGATAAKQKKASQLVKYAFGASFAFPTGAARANVKGALDELRAGYMDGVIGVIAVRRGRTRRLGRHRRRKGGRRSTG